jgi:hypothetical protein
MPGDEILTSPIGQVTHVPTSLSLLSDQAIGESGAGLMMLTALDLNPLHACLLPPRWVREGLSQLASSESGGRGRPV